MNAFLRKAAGIALVLALVFGVMAVAAPAYAQSDDDTSTTTEEQSDAEQIAELLALIEDLRSQIEDLLGQAGDLQQELRDATQLVRDLSRGMSGEDVEELQELLASDPDIYPEGLVTGFYGPLTERAVERFQERFGIETVGRVGPITRGTLNQIFKKGKHLDRVTVDADDLDDDDIDFSEYTPGTNGVLVCHRGKTIAIGGPAVRAHVVNHGDTIGECGGDDADSDDDDDDSDDEEEVTEQDAQDALDAAQAAIDEAQAAIDEADDGDAKDDAQAKLDQAQEKLDDAQEEFDDGDYDNAAEKAEDAEELAQEAEDTLNEEEADTTAPEITDIEAVVDGTSVTITWTTDEDADSSVWYSTDSGFENDADGVTMVHTGDEETSHSVTIDDLDPDTTYYFKVGSEDSSDNERISAEDEFTTGS